MKIARIESEKSDAAYTAPNSSGVVMNHRRGQSNTNTIRTQPNTLPKRTPLQLGAVYAAIALSDSIRAIFMDSYRFAVVPDALQGRVNGVSRLILFSVLTIGSSALGLSLEHLGVLPTVGIVWSGLLLITGFLFLSRHMRKRHSHKSKSHHAAADTQKLLSIKEKTLTCFSFFCTSLLICPTIFTQKLPTHFARKRKETMHIHFLRHATLVLTIHNLPSWLIRCSARLKRWNRLPMQVISGDPYGATATLRRGVAAGASTH